MNDQAFQLLMAQNSQTQQMISDLRKDLQTHYEADEKIAVKVHGFSATIRTLKWVIGTGLGILAIPHIGEAFSKVFK